MGAKWFLSVLAREIGTWGVAGADLERWGNERPLIGAVAGS